MQSDCLKLNCITLVWVYLCNDTDAQSSRNAKHQDQSVHGEVRAFRKYCTPETVSSYLANTPAHTHTHAEVLVRQSLQRTGLINAHL